MRMVDCVPLLEEAHVEGMQMEPGHSHEHEEDCEDPHHDHEAEHGHEDMAHDVESTKLGAVTGMDEHVWTSPRNAAEITLEIGEHLAELDPENTAVYQARAEDYAGKISSLDAEFEAFFQKQDDRTIVFGDRFPLLYFADAYHLDYYAAFPGCGTQTEPSAATIAFLTEKMEHEQIPTVWYIEFSNHLVADSIAEATGTKTAMFHTCHNVSKQELEAGVTYLSLMEQNLKTLQEFL
jgi:zinc transport system substrate-binding protein